jgi:hypothetical protein
LDDPEYGFFVHHDAGHVALAVQLVVEDVGAVLLEDYALRPAGNGSLCGLDKLRPWRIGGRDCRCKAYNDFPGDVSRPQVLPVAPDAGENVLFNFHSLYVLCSSTSFLLCRKIQVIYYVSRKIEHIII